MHLFRRPDGRHYAIFQPAPDLLGNEVSVTFHGSSNSRLGGIHSCLAGKMTVAQIAGVRLRQDYMEIHLQKRDA